MPSSCFPRKIAVFLITCDGSTGHGRRSRLVAANPGSLDEELAFALVARNGGCSFELRASFLEASEFLKQVAADARQQMVVAKRRMVAQGIDPFETRLRAGGHGDGDSAIQLNYRRWRNLRKFRVKGYDARPVGIGGSGSSRVTGGNRCLNGVGAASLAELLGAIERRKTALDEQPVPPRAVLIHQQDGLARRADAGLGSRCLNLHQGNQAVDLRFAGHEPGEDSPQA